MKVFLLDDHVLFAKSLELAFSNYDIDFKSFTKIPELYNELEHREADILLLDINIGHKNGFEVAKKLLDEDSRRKIVFLSGYDLIEYKRKAQYLGAYAYLNKNLSMDELFQALQSVAKGQVLLKQDTIDIAELSAREVEVLQYAAEGYKQQEIADLLFISRRTVNNHLQSINDKLQVNSTISAIMTAVELGIIRVKNI